MVSDPENALYDLVKRDLDRMLLSVPSITDPQAWAVIQSRFALMCEQLEYFASVSDSHDHRITFQNAITKLRSVQPKALCPA